ncbi:hypothetical protein [Fimbriiglobus ruber]|uniref:Uncharacterized protein n=1 Tax=Fimbriiglobus ruber TaxID=1908690 RepID=A0A225D8K4_9BACT|nr:hypothetical protein [Fimbriiglobus ruber]OWK35964.1 hypothetical protein FRUB_08527 [Fimbriiglobus ruber]
MAITVHLLAWMLSAAMQDGGIVCGGYTRVLVSYWILIGAVRLAVCGPALKHVIVASGWLPLTGLVI